MTNIGNSIRARISTRALAAAFAALSLVALGASGCREERQQTVGAEVRPTAETLPAAVTAADITGAPGQYAGKHVMLSGEVKQVMGPRIFTIGGPEFGGELLVVSDKALPPVADRNEKEYVSNKDIVLATGTVKNFVLAEVEKTLRLDLPDTTYITWANKPYLEASNVVITPRAKIAGEPGEPGATVTEPVTDLVLITGMVQKAPLIGKKVELKQATIQRVDNERAFWIGPDEQHMLFVVLDPAVDLKELQKGKAELSRGQVLMLQGDLQRAPEAAKMKEGWKLSPAEANAVAQSNVYLHVQRAELR